MVTLVPTLGTEPSVPTFSIWGLCRCSFQLGIRCEIWVWVNTYNYPIFSGMNIHKSQLFWGSLGTRVLTHPHLDRFGSMSLTSAHWIIPGLHPVVGAQRWRSLLPVLDETCRGEQRLGLFADFRWFHNVGSFASPKFQNAKVD